MQFRAGKFVVKNFTFILKGISHCFFFGIQKGTQHRLQYSIANKENVQFSKKTV